ncbi:MAG: hypothetical protein JW891_09800 [Candidatus Lokiarchaeota archaeon]|nr:hypothetical protein [Candidatus Lokiarchaeota archaeon]
MIEFNRNTNFRIDELEFLLEKKEVEIYSYKEKISELEEKLSKLEMADPNYKPSKKDKDNFIKRLEEKDLEIRELKDKLGFLRKENIDLKRKIEVETKKTSTIGSVIRIDREKPPFQVLVDDLQSKLNSQKFLIKNLKNELEGIQSDYQNKCHIAQELMVENEILKQKAINNEKELESVKHSLSNLEILYLEVQNSSEQKKMAYLNNKLKEKMALLELKESELDSLREKTVDIKIRCKDLESELWQKDYKISELLKHIYVE